MKGLILVVYGLLSVLVAFAGETGCLAVEGPVIRVSTLAPFIDQAPNLDLDRILTSTPDPGTQRWVTAMQIREWKLSPLAGLAPTGVCIERNLHPLQSEDIIREIQIALQRNRSEVRNVGITSVQPFLVPDGHLSLPSAGLQILSNSSGFCSFLWRGAFEFDSHRRISIRILGRYQADTSRFVAKRSLQPGDVLGKGDYEKIYEPGCSRGGVELAQPEGSSMRRALREGEGIEAGMLKAPPLVEAGAVVRVKATAGGALVSIEAIAEKSGARGEAIFVGNTESGKRIRVLLTGKGEASAIIAGITR